MSEERLDSESSRRIRILSRNHPEVILFILEELMDRLEERGQLNPGEADEIIRMGLNRWIAAGREESPTS